jgi:carbamoylphosphate synthase large subunit
LRINFTFEPVFWEHLWDIIQLEKPVGVIVQLGGQTALKLAEKLQKYGVRIMGTSYEALDLAEDRGSFSSLLKEMNIPYPEFGVATDADEALEVSKTIGFPLLVRPSYVLGGQSMKIVINEKELEDHIIDIWKHFPKIKYCSITFWMALLKPRQMRSAMAKMYTSLASCNTLNLPEFIPEIRTRYFLRTT